MGKIIAIANQKGGVGKTTTSINLSASLGVLEKKTLLIDADPQGNSTSGFGLDLENPKGDLYTCITSYLEALGNPNAHIIKPQNVIIPTSIPNLSILPANINLVGAELEFINFDERESILKNILSPLKAEYDYILIDCSPSLGLITVNALVAADSVIIPVQTEFFALEGLGKLINTIKIIQSRLNPSLTVEGILMTMYNGQLRLCNQVVAEVRKHFHNTVFDTIIHRNTKLSEAPSFGKPIILYDEESKGTINYINLAQEIIKKNNGNDIQIGTK
ncbi:MAG: AAA family ATPase [Phycisphaerales bacterium]|nr:AAA family ATPase [Phycisphaerales bacterium]